jgi:hypothetical protein
MWLLVYNTCGCWWCMLQLMDRDPQMAQMLNNPELLRESFNMMANPVSADAAHPCLSNQPAVTRQQQQLQPSCQQGLSFAA